MAHEGKVWFITGASSGFGYALAEQLIASGERVVVTARRASALAPLSAPADARVLALALDVTEPSSFEAALAEAVAHFGRIDVLVNNAGYSLVGAVEETPEPALRDVMETMFFGPALLTRAVVPRLRAQGGGTIVQMSSVGGFITAPGFSAYCAAKHALEAFSEALAAELAEFGVRVLIVEPGAFRTELFGPAFRAMPELPEYAASVGATRAYVASSAGRQPGDPVKAARAIVHAVSGGAHALRLPLGADAVAGMRDKLAQVGRDLDAGEVVAVATAL
jgi:NAD(P)-dependent dehydrogenase (short-subunit alcohol dehydrogenase family)